MSRGFWNSACKELSDKLITAPAKVEWVGENNIIKSKKLTIELMPNIKLPAHIKLTQIDNLMSCRKIKLKLNTQQKLKFKQCFDGHIYYYNKAINYLNKEYENQKLEFENNELCNIKKCKNKKDTLTICEHHKLNFSNSFEFVDSETCNVKDCENQKMKLFTCKEHKNTSLPWKFTSNISMREHIDISDEAIKASGQLWLLNVPRDTREMGMKSAITGLKSCITNKRAGNIKHFELRELSYRSASRIFWVSGKSFKVKNKTIRLFPADLKPNDTLKFGKKYEKFITTDKFKDSIILFDRGAYYLCLVTELPKINTVNNDSIISLDPGLRTFQTGYSPDGNLYKFGDNFNTDDINRRLDKIQSIMPDVKHKQYQRLKMRSAALRKKLKDRIDNMHNQTIAFLTKNYKNVLLPDFETSRMLSGDKLQSTSKRKMQNLAFYKFKQKLLNLGNRRGTNIYIVNESYTSMTCGNCGNEKPRDELKGIKIYTCNCGYNSDRDLHGARNILIKTMAGTIKVVANKN